MLKVASGLLLFRFPVFNDIVRSRCAVSAVPAAMLKLDFTKMPDVPRIEDEILVEGKLDQRWVSDKYFTRRYVASPSGEDICLNVHSNKVVVISLAPTHPIIKDKLKPTLVNFQVNDKLNRLDNISSGKGKHGAQQLQENSILCTITCEERPETPFKISSHIFGKLLEVNELLVNQPQLATEKLDAGGFIAIVLPRLHDFNERLDKLMTEDEYLAQHQQQQEQMQVEAASK